MDRRIRLTALMLAASLLLNMVVLPVHGQEDTAPSSAQVSQENEPTEEPTEVPTETVPASSQTTVPSTTMETQAPTVPEETTQAADYEEHNLLSKRSMVEKHFYPEPPKMKGRDRNKPCPCGSGRKFKNCCGRN